jgi:branched-chain amino acid transport system permease protein
MATAVQLLINGMVAGAQFGLLAVSLALIYNTTHFFNFAHGAVYTSAAYVLYLLAATGHLPASVSIALAVLTAAALGGLTELCVFKPLRSRGSSPVVLLLASLGLLIAFQNSISLVFGDEIRPVPGSTIQTGLRVCGARVTPLQLEIFFASVGVCLLVWLGLRHTYVGTMLRALSNDEELARIVGVRSSLMVLAAFCVGSSLAGMASVLSSYDTGIRPTMGFNALLMAIVGMVVGGVGNTSAAFWGGMTIGVVQQAAAWILPSKWQDSIVFAILIFVLLVRPQGIRGHALRKASV